MFPIASLQLVFDVLAKDNASGTFRDVGNAAEQSGKKTEAGLNRVSGAAKALGGLLVGAGIVGGLKSLFDAADESARITARTENVIKSMGNAAGVSAKQVGDLAGAIAAKTGVDDEAIQAGQNLLLTFGKIRNEAGQGNAIFDRTSQAMVDMSAAMGTDASGAAIQLGKAMNDPIKGITALSRAGVSFTEEQKQTIRTLVETGDVMGAQKIILGELEKQFGGAAEAMSTPMDRAKVAVGNVAEELGGYLLPIVADAADGLLGLIDGFKNGESSADGFVGSMQTTGAVLADVADFLVDVGGVIGDVVGFFADLPGPVLAGVGALTAFALLKGPIAAVFDTIALKALYASEAVGVAGFAGAARGLVGFLGGPWGIAIGAATIGLGFLFTALSSSNDATGDAAKKAQQATAAQQSLADAIRETNGVITEGLRQGAAKAAQDAGLLAVVEKTGRATTDVTDALLGNQDAYENVKTGLEQYITQQRLLSVGTAEGSQEHRRNADAAQAQLGVLEQLVGTYPQTVAAQNQLTDAVGGASATTATYEAQLQAAADAADDARAQTNLLKDALDALTGANVSVDQATLTYYNSLNEARESLGDLSGEVIANNGLLDLSNARGAEVANRLIELSQNSHGYLAALQTQGAAQADVSALDTQLRDSFFQTARQMTGNDNTARALTDRYYGIPGDINTTITADTSQADGAVNDFVARVTGKRVVLTGDFVGGAGVNVRRAFGGPVHGPGSTTSDSIHALLSNDEHVWSAAEVRGAGGHDQVEQLRKAARAGTLAHFAAGGAVLADRYAIPVSLTGLENIQVSAGVGSGGVGGGWESLWNLVKAAIPEARQNSTYRAGDPGYHGRGKAIDFGYGSGPGGAGSAGLASINRFLHDNVGGNLAELIYDGLADDRPDLYHGAPHTYNAGTQAEHRNHVHAAVYDRGGLLPPGLTLAYNGTGQNETIRTAGQEAAMQQPMHVSLQLDGRAVTDLLDGRVVTAITTIHDRGAHNG